MLPWRSFEEFQL